jgi:hypothetical protein
MLRAAEWQRFAINRPLAQIELQFAASNCFPPQQPSPDSNMLLFLSFGRTNSRKEIKTHILRLWKRCCDLARCEPWPHRLLCLTKAIHWLASVSVVIDAHRESNTNSPLAQQ